MIVDNLLFGQTANESENPPIIQLEPGLDARCVAQVSVDSARLIRAVPQWWSRQFKWEGVRFACDRRTADGSIPFTWNVPGLGIAGGGAIVNVNAGAAQWNWHLTAEREWPVEGEPGARQPHGGLTFFLDLKSAARRGCTADPVLQAEKTGFTWEIDRHARRLAQLGVNLVRLTHVDSDWVHPQLIARGPTTENLDDQAVRGSFSVDTPKTQMVMGWIKDQPFRTADASFSIAVPKAAVALSSLDQQPLRHSKKILVSTIGRMAIGADKQARTEPVAGTIALSSTAQRLRFFPLHSDGSRGTAIPLEPRDGTYTIVLPTDKQTHWFMLEE